MRTWASQLKLLYGICMFALFWNLFNSEAVTQYINSVKGQSVTVVAKQDWEQKLQAFKQQHDAAPIDARIDQVWKAIPGYNGLQVDVEASLAQMSAAGKWDTNLIVVDEVEPTVQLEDLDPSPIYRGNAQKPMVAFMINVAWGNEYLPKMLETLEKYEVKSTFFLDGSWTNRFPDEARKIVEAGHEIGNHAYSHPDMKTLSMNRIRLELMKTNEVIEEQLEVKPVVFAPPSGSFDNRSVQLAAQQGMYTILWTLDTIDWQKPSPDQILNRITPRLSHGALILMHPTASSMKALPKLLEAARKKGLQAGTVSALISSKRADSY
jgi:probable sporulation protein (polysaccharide deacetylase family)